MGRQTKSDKIIADLRRQLDQLQKENRKLKKRLGQKAPQKKKKAPSASPSKNKSNPHKTHQYVQSDLTKSLVLAILVISLEFLLYWQL